MDGFVSWAQTVDWQAWAIFAQAAAIFAAAFVAGRTAQQVYWERAARRQNEVAEEALSIILQATSVFQELRNLLSYGSEDDRDLSHSDQVRKMFQERLKNNKEFFSAYFQLVPRVRAFFGSEAETHFKIVGTLRNEFVGAVNSYTILSEERERSEELNTLLAKARETIWFVKPGSFEERLEAAQVGLESLLSPFLRPPKRINPFRF